VVQTLDATLLGDLTETSGGTLRLDHPVIGEQHGRAPMDGFVIIPVERICWVQVLP
jgi:hypothetical protein